MDQLVVRDVRCVPKLLNRRSSTARKGTRKPTRKRKNLTARRRNTKRAKAHRCLTLSKRMQAEHVAGIDDP